MVSFPNILTQGKLLIAEKLPIKINIFCYLGRCLYYEKEHLGKAAKTSGSFVSMNSVQFRMRYHSCKQVPHNVAPQDIHINELRQNITAIRN